MTDSVTVIDLFAGAGGCSTGVAQACEDLGYDRGDTVELHAINHWPAAIETHEANHPWAEHYCAKIEELHPPDIAEPGSVDLLALENPSLSSFGGGVSADPDAGVPEYPGVAD